MNFLFAGCFSFLEPDAKLIPQNFNLFLFFLGFQTEFQGHAKQESQMHLYSTITNICIKIYQIYHINIYTYIIYHIIYLKKKHIKYNI